MMWSAFSHSLLFTLSSFYSLWFMLWTTVVDDVVSNLIWSCSTQLSAKDRKNESFAGQIRVVLVQTEFLIYKQFN